MKQTDKSVAEAIRTMRLKNIPDDFYDLKALGGNPSRYYYFTPEDIELVDKLLAKMYHFDKKKQDWLFNLAVHIQHGKIRCIPETMNYLRREFADYIVFKEWQKTNDQKASDILTGKALFKK